MATTLALLRDRVEQILMDATNLIWATADIDEAIRRALHDYSLASPLHKITTITLAANGREISTSAITDAIAIEEVWVPYTAATPEYPPNKQPFRYWKEPAKLWVAGAYSPVSGNVVRIFYTSLHLLSELDSASSTTLADEHTSIVALGASGYAATSRALDIAEQISVDRETADNLVVWGLKQLQQFRQDLSNLPILVTLSPADLERMARWATDRLAEFRQQLTTLVPTVTLSPADLERMARWAELQLRRFTDALNQVAIATQGPGHVPLPALDRHDNTWA